jgi:hypothetical protein
MKKTDLAKTLGISRATLYRWEKEGVLEQKLNELRKEREIVGQPADTEILLKEINEKLNMLQYVAKMLQDVLNMLQNVSNMLQDVAMSQNVSNMSHNVTDSLSQNVSIVPHNVAEKLQSVTDYFTASQLAKIVGVARRTINDWILEGRIQSAKLQGKNLIPKEEALKLIFKRVYDELNAINHYGDSVPVPVFKDAVKKKLNISDDEIEKTLLDLDTEEVLYLQTLDRPSDFSDSDRGIKFEGRILYFITWMNEKQK